MPGTLDIRAVHAKWYGGGPGSARQPPKKTQFKTSITDEAYTRVLIVASMVGLPYYVIIEELIMQFLPVVRGRDEPGGLDGLITGRRLRAATSPVKRPKRKTKPKAPPVLPPSPETT